MKSIDAVINGGQRLKNKELPSHATPTAGQDLRSPIAQRHYLLTLTAFSFDVHDFTYLLVKESNACYVVQQGVMRSDVDKSELAFSEA